MQFRRVNEEDNTVRRVIPPIVVLISAHGVMLLVGLVFFPPSEIVVWEHKANWMGAHRIAPHTSISS